MMPEINRDPLLMRASRSWRPISPVEYSALLLGMLFAIALVVIRALGEGLLEKGDGVSHYLIARYCWRHPTLLLDLWGKPLFTLLASPFAQAGHIGVAVFNAVVAVVTAWFGVLALRRAGGAAQVAFPILMILAPQYVLMVIAGMTEPLFGLLTVLTVLLLIWDRPAMAAVVASLAPFARPEYVAFLPFIGCWLLLDRKWRALPWCLAGTAVYMALTAISFGDPFWFWAEDPYHKAGAAYGSGPWNFFVQRADEVFGLPLLLTGLGALLLWPVVWRADRNERRTHLLMLLTAAAPVIAIVAIHSALWFIGTRGSAGLLRVLVTAVPLAALFTAMTLGRGAILLFANVPRSKIIAGLGILCLGVWSVWDLDQHVDLPAQAGADQRILDEAAAGIKKYHEQGALVFSTHPYMAFGAGLDPYDQGVYHTLYGLEDDAVNTRFRVGDLLLWDAQLGTNESGIPLETLLNDTRFTLLETFEPTEGYRVFGGHVYEIFLFQRRDAVRTSTIDTLIWNGRVVSDLIYRADRQDCGGDTLRQWCLDPGEFPLELGNLQLPLAGSLYDEWMVSAVAKVEDGASLSIVFGQSKDGHGVRYDREEVVSGPLWFSRRVPPAAPGSEQKIYFWNTGRKPFSLEGLSVLRKRWVQRPA